MGDVNSRMATLEQVMALEKLSGLKVAVREDADGNKFQFTNNGNTLKSVFNYKTATLFAAGIAYGRHLTPPQTTPNRIEGLYRGLHILFQYRDRIDFGDTDFSVIHKTAALISAPEHSNSGYISVGVADGELPDDDHKAILGIEGWQYEYPYYVFYML
jgi:hypothetical protein